ncbi:MAG TPA: recombinase RecA [Caldisericia bacterium]|nr:recombinase RecA [Caldisericia bacterium]
MEEKDKALESAMMQVTRTYGKGSIMKMGDSVTRMSEDVVSSGIFSLDVALGVGGFPRGRIIEIYGAEGSGKSTIALQAIAECQKKKGKAVYIDAEHALDPYYAQTLGIKLEELVISQPDYGEQALEIAEILIRSGAVDLIVIDSVAALVPKAELDGNMGDQQMGLQARLMSQAMRKLAGVLNKSGCSAIFINQLREKIGIVFGNPETTTGGRALKFYSSVRLEIRRGDLLKDGEVNIGQEVRVKVVKNKVAPPYTTCTFDLMYGKGVSHVSSVLSLALQKEIIAKSGSWYSYGDNKIGQGQENVKKFLTDNPEILTQIENKVKEAYGLKVTPPEPHGKQK